MINQLFKKISLVCFILAGIGWGLPLAAQSDQLTKGSIITSVDAVARQDGGLIRIRGKLDPNQLERGFRYRKGSGQKFTVTLSNALLDPDKFKSKRLTFSSSKPVSLINLKEEMNEQRGDATFQLNLEISGRKDFEVELVTPASESILMIKLTDKAAIAQKEAEKKQEEAKAMELEKQQQAREEAETAKKRDVEEKSKAVMEAKKSVDDMLQKFRRPSIMQLSIINASGWQKRAYKLSVFLQKEKLSYIEESLGMKLDIVNVSNAKDDTHAQSTIYFRDSFLKAALFLAGLIPGEQKLVPVSSKRERLGVDIEIYLGKDYK